ncbi:MAG: ATP-binding cassette domain-containing protein [Deltaproteobacteria bacterium]|nr:MAG: ATP-binding cassette domain-containing protein [Deltaproteobacteria bacterium]
MTCGGPQATLLDVPQPEAHLDRTVPFRHLRPREQRAVGHLRQESRALRIQLRAPQEQQQLLQALARQIVAHVVRMGLDLREQRVIQPERELVGLAPILDPDHDVHSLRHRHRRNQHRQHPHHRAQNARTPHPPLAHSLPRLNGLAGRTSTGPELPLAHSLPHGQSPSNPSVAPPQRPRPRAPTVPMIQLDSISHAFGDRALFRDLSWQLHPGARIGLVGPNGAGKTTLFRILAGDLVPDTGRVILPRDASIGLLPQDVGDLGDCTAIEHVLEGCRDLLDEADRIQDLRQQLDDAVARGEDSSTLESLSADMAEREERFRARGGYGLRARAASILGGMGFDTGDLDRHVSTFSGGKRVRIVLSKLLLQRPDVLLMDEPTNHLDVPSVEWLEGFLSNYRGTVVVISHDRYFLNRLVTEIAGLEYDGLHVHPGTWDDYMAARDERAALLEARKAQQDRSIRETERFIERFRAKATKARQVQSRVKQLDKVERITLDEQRGTIHFRFPEAGRSGRMVVEAEKLGRDFGDLTVFGSVDFSLERDERVALVGPNGAGKSTLLRLLAEDLAPSRGEIRIGHNVVRSYFAQHSVDSLDLRNSILEEMESAATTDTFPLCRSILGAFLFSGDDVERRISVLSGGERNRVALARMLLRPANLLLLDEPTNHLDISSRDVLVDALRNFNGTVLFVSHDRHFINQLATRVVHIEDGTLESTLGDYEYYRHKRRAEGLGGSSGLLADAGPTPRDPKPARPSSAESAAPRTRRDRKRIEAEWRNRMNRETRELRAAVEDAETRMAAAEERRAELEGALADPALYAAEGNGARIAALQTDLAATLEEIDNLLAAWEDAAATLEAREAHWQQQLQELLSEPDDA